MREYLIENVTDEEFDRLERSELEINWFPDDITGIDIYVYGCQKDVQKVLEIMGRK